MATLLSKILIKVEKQHNAGSEHEKLYPLTQNFIQN